MFELLENAVDIYEGVSDHILSQQASEIVNAETIMESPVMQDYLDGPLTGNTVAKKLMATALGLAVDKGYVPLPEKYANPQAIATIADNAVETIKIAYDVASGNLRADKAANFVTQKAAAVAKTVADRVIDQGAEIAANTITNALAAHFPPIVIVRPYIVMGSKFVAQKTKKLVAKGIDKIAEVTKPIVKTAVEKVQKVATTVRDKVKKVGNKMLNWALS
ncbi:MAG: hypothetical protein K6F33_02905 [Bacteroidales bacterium]|nr:hypothetical protein [Bacteroidales bacterium]